MRALYVVQSGAVALYALLAGIKVSASGVDPGFANPDVVYRPKFRYWLPDASVPADVVQEDIARIAEAGGGGIEFLPFYLYGLPTAQSMNATPPTDWNVYGFGTPAFNDLFRAALNASKESKVRMDFAIGANQGQGVPAVPGTPGLAVQLLLGNTSVRAGERYSSTVPPPAELSSVLQSGLTFMHPLEDFGTPNLTAVIAYQVRNDLDPLSFVDLSAKVKDGLLDWTPPLGNSTWRIFSFWVKHTNQRSCTGGLNPTTVIGNGSWVVDHFDAMGARLITDFWDHHILSDEQTLTFLQEVGQYAWEDSIEMLSSLYWTPSLLTRFEQDRGYSALPCLPALFKPQNNWNAIAPSYNEIQWTHRIGIQYSHQPAYNLPLEMLGDIPLPDAPECESLGFGDNVDAYRQFSGPAHLSNRNVVSNEMGAVFKPAYMLTIPELLYSIKRAWSGGVNMVVLHGYTYSGNYPNTTWPGYTAFNFEVSEMWNQFQPAWIHMKDYLDYISRNQYVLQQGRPQVDLALYLYETPWSAVDLLHSNNITAAGYTYDYVAPDNLVSPQATVRAKVLAPDGPNYKALVFASPEYNISTFNLVREDVAARVVKFAQKGLPVVFVGGLPQVTSNSQAGQIVEDGWRRLRNLPSVQFISSLADLPGDLSKAGVRPDVLPSCTTGTLRVVKRSRPDDEVDYVFLHNDQAVPTSCQISIQEHKARTPHLLNAWTGEKKMIDSFERRSAMVTVSLQFAPNETSILSLEKSGSRDLTKLTKTASSSTIRHYGIANLTRWDLSIEDFHAPHSRFQVQTAITSHNFSNIAIRPWSAISPELAKVGGIGRYSTSFTVPSVSRIRGKLSLGPIIHTARVYIGGQRLPPIDPVNPVIDISSYIRPGQTYKLIVEVTTPLFNRIKTDANHTKIAGSTAVELQPLYASTPYQEYGLMGPVVVTWSIST
ncbi:hypothetical protein KXW39_003236 [Aspergillus fumigatus]|nr:hypothetical protein KXX17_003627 [Aspergillus fumigatus]KAH1747739.1 hypothetical protein KXX56_002743 [Aspergillus fumigatus]KAH3300751.1 hypothetical protein KXV87_003368 [Aspergillus fumigatus]KAH3434230.1 hypothetical protein KXW39_003236 [Aspergillus fumigatus]